MRIQVIIVLFSSNKDSIIILHKAVYTIETKAIIITGNTLVSMAVKTVFFLIIILDYLFTIIPNCILTDVVGSQIPG